MTQSQSHACIPLHTDTLYNNPTARTPGGVLKIVCGLLLPAASRALSSSEKTWATRQFTACLHSWDTPVARHTLCSHLINETGDQTEAQFSVYTQDSWRWLGTIVVTVWWHWSEVGILSVSPLLTVSSCRIFPAALWVRQQSNDWLTPGFRDGLFWYALPANLMRSMQHWSSG